MSTSSHLPAHGEPDSWTVEFANDTGLVLMHEYAHADHGEFGSLPPAILNPRTAGVFAIRARKGNAGAGWGGNVRYANEERLRITLWFDKPYVGSNSAHARIDGDEADCYACDTSIALDGVSLRCRFFLRKVES